MTVANIPSVSASIRDFVNPVWSIPENPNFFESSLAMEYA
jgi:hypothetical protein